MSWTNTFKTAAAIASVSVFASISTAYAQDEAAEAKPAAEASELGVPAQKAEKAFFPLVRCARIEGQVQIQKPRDGKWIAAEEGRLYPLGSLVRTGAGSTAALEFGEKALMTVEADSEVATREIEIGEQPRVVVLKRGRVHFDLPRKLADGLFKVVTPNFECVNLAGESVFEFAAEGDGNEVLIRCVTGSLALNGAHYAIPRMSVANQVRIRTTGDALFTSIRGESGDCHVMLAQGVVVEKNFETGESKDVPKQLEYVLSPKCAVKIFRAKSALSGRVAVSTMTFGAAGEMVNRFAFAEGLSNVNSGELVVADKVAAVTKSKDSEDDDSAETVEAKPAKDDEDGEKKDEKKDDEDSGL